MPELFILLPVHNRKETTLKFVQCLKNQTFQKFKLILIDDGSVDGTAEAVCEQLPETIVIEGSGDWWWGGSLQQGYLWLKENSRPEDFVLISNDDVEFEESFLETGINKLKRLVDTLLLAEAWSSKTRKKVDQGIHINWFNFSFDPLPPASSINCLSTRGLMLRVEDMSEIGGFIPEKLPHYCSDYEFTIRGMKKGYQLVTSPDFKLVLDEEQTGIHQVDKMKPRDYIKTLFSIKSAKNPLTLTRFVFLSAPVHAIPFAFVRIWVGSIVRMAITILRG
jgi:GT2 family glycosyltransferase